MKRSTLVLLSLGLGAFAGCSVKTSGLEWAHANTGGALSAGGGGGNGGSGGSETAAGGGSGLGTGGKPGGDAATAPDDGRKPDTVASTGGEPGTGGAVPTGGAASGGTGGLSDQDGAVATGGLPGTGGVAGAGGGPGTGGAGGTDAPPGSDVARDTADGRRDVLRDVTPDLGPDVPLDTPPDIPIGPDLREPIDAPRNEAGQALTLAWSDEFDGEAGSVDVGKWAYVTWAPGTVNNEAQQYTSSVKNVFQDGDGHLVIRALYSAGADPAYTSGRIETNGKFSFGPGHRIEVLAKLPAGKGSFPAILMKGVTGTWPDSGALGLMEQYGQDKSWFYATAYGPSAAGSGRTDKTKYAFPNATSASAEWHLYALDWYWDHLVFWVDGHVTLTSNYAPSSPFYTITEYIVLNVALGGDMGEEIDNNAFPMEMVVDYVRVYNL
jgi:beta-glucanase (GH16 family)